MCVGLAFWTTLYTRGVQKVRRLTQLTTRYAHHILSLFNIVACSWNALGPAFLQSSDSGVEDLLFLVFQPAICCADPRRQKICVLSWILLVCEINRSHLELGQRTCSHVSSSTGCHPTYRLWTTPSSTVFAIRIRIARQMAGWKTKNNNSSTTESELWRNVGPSAFQLQVTMLKSG